MLLSNKTVVRYSHIIVESTIQLDKSCMNIRLQPPPEDKCECLSQSHTTLNSLELDVCVYNGIQEPDFIQTFTPILWTFAFILIDFLRHNALIQYTMNYNAVLIINHFLLFFELTVINTSCYCGVSNYSS